MTAFHLIADRMFIWWGLPWILLSIGSGVVAGCCSRPTKILILILNLILGLLLFLSKNRMI